MQANKAAIKAIVINRVGDVGPALGVFSVFVVFKTCDYSVVFSLVPHVVGVTYNFLGFEVDALSTIGLLLFVGLLENQHKSVFILGYLTLWKVQPLYLR